MALFIQVRCTEMAKCTAPIATGAGIPVVSGSSSCGRAAARAEPGLGRRPPIIVSWGETAAIGAAQALLENSYLPRLRVKRDSDKR